MAYKGKNLGKYSFRNAEGNWSISTDIGILQEYFCHTLVNSKYYLYNYCITYPDFYLGISNGGLGAVHLVCHAKRGGGWGRAKV